MYFLNIYGRSCMIFPTTRLGLRFFLLKGNYGSRMSQLEAQGKYLLLVLFPKYLLDETNGEGTGKFKLSFGLVGLTQILKLL